MPACGPLQREENLSRFSGSTVDAVTATSGNGGYGSTSWRSGGVMMVPTKECEDVMDHNIAGTFVAQIDVACGDEQRLVCEWVFNRTSSNDWARIADWFVDRPLRILFILFLAFVISRLLRRVVQRFSQAIADRQIPRSARPENQERREGGVISRTLGGSDAQRQRAERRARTLGSVLQNLVTVVVWTVAFVLVLGEIGISLGPLIASAGIAGIALGFGAQSVVKDFLAGLFVLIEDQYGVGDVIDVGEAVGVVEEVELRTTQIRDINGVLWTVPNGVIERVGNHSQLWSKSIFDIEVPYECDIDDVMAVMKRVLDEVWEEDFRHTTIIEEPEVQGIQAFGANGVVIRAAVKTDTNEQWATARMIRGRLKKALDEAGISIPYPQRTIWLKNADDAALPEIQPADD